MRPLAAWPSLRALESGLLVLRRAADGGVLALLQVFPCLPERAFLQVLLGDAGSGPWWFAAPRRPSASSSVRSARAAPAASSPARQAGIETARQLHGGRGFPQADLRAAGCRRRAAAATAAQQQAGSAVIGSRRHDRISRVDEASSIVRCAARCYSQAIPGRGCYGPPRGSWLGNRCVTSARVKRGGKSGLQWTRCQVTPGGREPTESATESRPPKCPARSNPNRVPARVKRCGKSAPRRW